MNNTNSKSLSIGVLSITALILFIAQFLPVRSVQAMESIKDRDYSLLTARSARGGETLYVVDNRTGQMAVFNWDAARRAFTVSGVGPLANAFQ